MCECYSAAGFQLTLSIVDVKSKFAWKIRGKNRGNTSPVGV